MYNLPDELTSMFNVFEHHRFACKSCPKGDLCPVGQQLLDGIQKGLYPNTGIPAGWVLEPPITHAYAWTCHEMTLRKTKTGIETISDRIVKEEFMN